jgi:hypothetical protein
MKVGRKRRAEKVCTGRATGLTSLRVRQIYHLGQRFERQLRVY